MRSNRDIVASFYAALAAGDAVAALGAMAEDMSWIGMEGWPYRTAGPGPAGIARGILAPMMADWQLLAVAPEAFHDAGDVIVATGRYGGVHRATGKTLEAAFAHLWTVRDGKLVGFRQFTDTLLVDRAMQ